MAPPPQPNTAGQSVIVCEK